MIDWQKIWEFLNSSFFVATVTLLAGLVAYWLYKKKTKDDKKDAANILLLEIQSAERQIQVAKERLRKNEGIEDDAYLMPTESWSKYKYQFVRDFDRDEWDSISAFFERCKSYDEAVAHKSAAFKKNEAQMRLNMQRITADYVKDAIENAGGALSDDQKSELFSKIDVFQDQYIELPASLNQYSPQKPITQATTQLNGIAENLSQTSIGSKLKTLAGVITKTKNKPF